MRKFREIANVNGRKAVEFLRDREHRYYWRLAVRKTGRLRRDDANGPCESYAAALVDVAEHEPWVAQTVGQEWALELLRGHTFRSAEHDESYGDHHHCVRCWRTLAPVAFGSANSAQTGFVTRYYAPKGGGFWQWNWVCPGCFAELRERFEWAEGEPANAPF